MKRSLIVLATFCLGLSVNAQSPEDKKAMKSLCGCYSIDFRYAETFSGDSSYKVAKPYIAKGLEWAELIEEAPGKMVIQHLLVINDSTVIKHWREDWTYQNRELLVFDKKFVWKKNMLSAEQVKGQWSQTIWEVDDAPRYQGTATWVHADGRSRWENNTDAPLPRREYKIRSDYNVLNRNNRIQLTASGWLHEQDNQKILRTDGAPDRVLVQEKGYNIYHRVDDKLCANAKKWWLANSKDWIDVRKEWNVRIANADKEVRL